MAWTRYINGCVQTFYTVKGVKKRFCKTHCNMKLQPWFLCFDDQLNRIYRLLPGLADSSYTGDKQEYKGIGQYVVSVPRFSVQFSS